LMVVFGTLARNVTTNLRQIFYFGGKKFWEINYVGKPASKMSCLGILLVGIFVMSPFGISSKFV